MPFYSLQGQPYGWLYPLTYTGEECGEVLDIILFIRALLLYVDTHLKAVSIPSRDGG
jgi:hypothetical protein